LNSEFTFKRAIVRTPCKNFVNGITSANLGKPDYELAMIQHEQYISTLEGCGVDVTVLLPDDAYPDSVFVEDTALLIPECAIITNPGAPSRKGEVVTIKKVLNDFYKSIVEVNPPGTIDGGDILAIDNHYYIGLSDRTNYDGAKQVIDILKKYGKTASSIEVKNFLHLKSGIAYLGNRHLIMTNEFPKNSSFKEFIQIRTEENENYAANCVNINGNIIFPKGYERTKQRIERSGFSLMEVDVSEFRKLDGGVSCLSLRF
jgi:dimethylargininase